MLIFLFQEIVKKLQVEYDEHHEYQEGIQDCEKWILQMSFRIMSHNALNVSSMELCKRQIEKHSVSRFLSMFNSVPTTEWMTMICYYGKC
jgi:hypothetical protein